MRFFIVILSLILVGSFTAFSGIPVQNTFTDFINKFNPIYWSLYTSQQATQTKYRIIKFGYNLDVDATPNEDVWSVGGSFSRPSAAETLSIVSSDAADDDGSTGATTILIACIGSDGTESDITVTMDGTTPVVTTETCLFVNRAKVTVSGSGATNAGNITITQSTSGDTLAYIPAGYSITQQALYRVPSDRICYVNHIFLNADKLAGSDPRVTFYVKVFNGTTETVYRRELLDTNIDTSREIEHFTAVPILGDEIILIEADSDTANTEVSAEIDMTCRDV